MIWDHGAIQRKQCKQPMLQIAAHYTVIAEAAVGTHYTLCLLSCLFVGGGCLWVEEVEGGASVQPCRFVPVGLQQPEWVGYTHIWLHASMRVCVCVCCGGSLCVCERACCPVACLSWSGPLFCDVCFCKSESL